MKISLFIECDPTPKARPKFSRGICYTPTKTKDAEEYIREYFVEYLLENQLTSKKNIVVLGKTQLKITLFEDRPVIATMIFNLIKPNGRKNPYATSRSDLDNYVKLCSDALNNVAYKDDAQIISIHAKKQYSDKKGIELTLEDIEQ